jgi:hypothetical protein
VLLKRFVLSCTEGFIRFRCVSGLYYTGALYETHQAR